METTKCKVDIKSTLRGLSHDELREVIAAGLQLLEGAEGTVPKKQMNRGVPIRLHV